LLYHRSNHSFSLTFDGTSDLSINLAFFDATD